MLSATAAPSPRSLTAATPGPVVQYIRGQEQRLLVVLERLNELYQRLDV